MEAGGARLWFVGLVTAAVWELFKHAAIEPGTHHLALTYTPPTRGITLGHTHTNAKNTWISKTKPKLFEASNCFFTAWNRTSACSAKQRITVSMITESYAVKYSVPDCGILEKLTYITLISLINIEATQIYGLVYLLKFFT